MGLVFGTSEFTYVRQQEHGLGVIYWNTYLQEQLTSGSTMKKMTPTALEPINCSSPHTEGWGLLSSCP